MIGRYATAVTRSIGASSRRTPPVFEAVIVAPTWSKRGGTYLTTAETKLAPVRGTIWVGLRPNIAEDAAQDVVAHLVDEDAGTHQNYDQDVDREAHDAVVLAALSDA